MAAVLNIFTGVQHPETNQQDVNAGQQGLLSRVRVILPPFLGRAALEPWSHFPTESSR